MSKIHFESKSQLTLRIAFKEVCCFTRCQRYILKANHNELTKIPVPDAVVLHDVKDTFWKQITTSYTASSESTTLFYTMSKIHFESKSQHNQKTVTKWLRCFTRCQRYILKANHNVDAQTGKVKGVVLHDVKDTFWKQITTPTNLSSTRPVLFYTMSKIHFESKSQLIMLLCEE